MRNITLTDYETQLRKLASTCGSAKAFVAKRKAWEETVLVLDEDGNPVDTSTIEVEVKSADTDDGDADTALDIRGLVREELSGLRAEIGAKAKTAIASSGSDGVEFRSMSYGDRHAVKHVGKGLPDQARQKAAFELGCFFRAVRGDQNAIVKCGELGIPLTRSTQRDDLITKGNVVGVNSAGGFLVPEQMAGYIIRLVEEFGVFRANSRVFPMSSDTANIPRRASGYTTYYVGEASSPTQSQIGFDNVKLSARKLGVLTKVSNELLADSTIAFGDFVAAEMALAMANAEDDAGFNGDGTSTYGGIVGARTRLSILNGVDDGGGLVLGSGNLYSEITTNDLSKLMSIVPQLPGMNTKFYCSQNVYGQILLNRSTSVVLSGAVVASSTQMSELVAGPAAMTYMGRPIVVSQVMPKTDANSQICLLYGDLAYASTFGNRSEMVIKSSDSALNAFEQDETAFVAFHRFDINNHDLGTSTAAGPLVGLITAAS